MRGKHQARRPILLLRSVIHRALSCAVVMMADELSGAGSGNSLMWPAGVMRPILPTNVRLCTLGIISVNQMAPSGPVVISLAKLLDDSENSLIWPAGVMRPILPGSVNQRLPSGPAVMPLA